MADLHELLAEVVGDDGIASGDAVNDDYAHDESLVVRPRHPDHVVRPRATDEVAAIVRLAGAHGVPVTARGSGTGLSGACVPEHGGIVVSFERMRRILEIDLANHVAVVQPGVTLAELDAATAPHGLVYPVFPGELSASLGGNVATNAGGMRAVRYGVTRHQVLGVEAVIGTGEVLRAGGKFVKSSSGYDLTQLIVGSEGTLALVTEAILRLHPRLTHAATVLAPFARLDDVAAAVPAVVGSGLAPAILEYIDLLSMSAITTNVGLDLGVPPAVQGRALAYLVVVVEDRSADRLDDTVEALAALLADQAALDVYVLPPGAAAQLIDGREKAFWAAKAAGADDVLDMVVPRAQIPEYLRAVAAEAQATGSLVVGCGHAGDGNVHLSVFQPDPERRREVVARVLDAGAALGGAVSGEHGVGRAKRADLRRLEDPAKLALMARIKTAFDPLGILNPGAVFDPGDVAPTAADVVADDGRLREAAS